VPCIAISYFIIAIIIHGVTNYMSCLVGYMLPISESELARQTEDLPRTVSLASRT
jgi:hypothetical protein